MLKGHGKLDVYGVLLHTTGDGPCARAKKNGSDPYEEALKIYKAQEVGPHFVIGPKGEMEQLRSTSEIAWHAGVSKVERRDYLTGNWEYTPKRLSAEVVKWWKDKWVGFASPQHLYRADNPNKDYIGIELVPCGTYNKSAWEPIFAPRCHVGARFSAKTIMRVSSLCAALGLHHKLPVGWEETQRLLGHEDVNPYQRPGWDPGDMLGAISWPLVRECVAYDTVQMVAGGKHVDIK